MQNYLHDMLIRIKNGYRARLSAIVLHPSTTQLSFKVLNIMIEEGYILGYTEYLKNDKKNVKKKVYCVFLKYNNLGVPVVQSVFIVSKPTRRIYLSLKALLKPQRSTGLFILSTIEGLMVDRDARQRNLGGEVLCGIY
jgi:small subunit ribosomal protein S8